jgi:uncharacterized protein DUF1236
MRKNTLMVAAAVAALTAGSSMAFAQGAPESHRGGAGAGPAGAQSNPAAKSAPAEKMAPGAGGAAQHTPAPGAQRSEEKSAPANRMGQANEGNKAKETTGQATKGLNERNEKMGEERNKSKAGTTGQAPSDQRATPKSDKFKGDAANERNERNANERNERNRTTTGQGAPENRNKMENRENRDTMENRGGTENRGSVSGTNRSNTNVKVNLSSEQKTKIHTIIVSERSAPRVSRVDFSVNVGTVVPRTIKLAPIPTTIVEIEPTWRGFEYFLVGDEIVVVDPATLQIVAVLPA